MIISAIQRELQEVYALSCEESVEDFLWAGTKPAHFLEKHPWLHGSGEALFVEQKEEELELGLWFHPQLLEWSESQHWQRLSMDELSISKMATLIEGVSHFVYLVSRANEEKAVTQLELELQAEVDKFVLLSRGIRDLPMGALMESLFGKADWNPHLPAEARARYEAAFKFASQYCDYLRKNSFPFTQDLMQELRSFYRMNQAEKIQHIS